MLYFQHYFILVLVEVTMETGVTQGSYQIMGTPTQLYHSGEGKPRTCASNSLSFPDLPVQWLEIRKHKQSEHFSKQFLHLSVHWYICASEQEEFGHQMPQNKASLIFQDWKGRFIQHFWKQSISQYKSL